jgi:hypothetical protein
MSRALKKDPAAAGLRIFEMRAHKVWPLGFFARPGFDWGFIEAQRRRLSPVLWIAQSSS